MAARSTSVSASLMGLPASPASARPISVRRRPITEDAFARIAPRSYAGRLRIVSAAATAAAVASSTWASLASQVEPTGESSQGLVTGSDIVRPVPLTGEIEGMFVGHDGRSGGRLCPDP